jgi:hypothetical protein
VRIEVLSFEGCPNAESTRELVRQAVQLEAVDATIEFIEVDSPALAQEMRFLGSPSVRIDGKDVEPSADSNGVCGLTCRMYRVGSESYGKPPIAMIRAAIRRGMKSKSTNNASRDILSNVWQTALLFWLPIIVLIVSGFIPIGQALRTVVWVAALSVMGTSCVVNALRCARVHCYATGPFFLAMAVVALLYGLSVIPLGKDGWNFIGGAVLIGALVLCCLPEALLGRYGQGRGTDP